MQQSVALYALGAYSPDSNIDVKSNNYLCAKVNSKMLSQGGGLMIQAWASALW